MDSEDDDLEFVDAKLEEIEDLSKIDNMKRIRKRSHNIS